MRQDIVLDKYNELVIGPDGDFVIDSSAQQEVILLLESEKGMWRQSPTVGAGIQRYIRKVAGKAPLVDNVNRLLREMKVTLQADGFVNPGIILNPDLSDFKVTVEP